ncbi:polyprenyl diphosphate synthase [Rhodopila globiformis]|uniref:Isoprenyl transferase n=1 Tax=Rhodopila globiformis TaxID=1071 RepID=A0A2S6MY48_RHOGL|nr:polyprenyl diphosphate synthase [Rhodopila globiformis]PPQ27287.1 di-trans,poly-cis-decaprenylcistransferase [Rhodopila globiformis]
MPVITERVIETYDQPSTVATPGVAASDVIVADEAPCNRAAHAAAGSADVLPVHVAIIMDGNGRWAKSRSLPRVAGHREGARAVRRTVEAAIRAGVSWLTIYAFSSENWRRPAGEIMDLTGLLRRYLRSEIVELKENGVRLRFIGDRARFDRDIQTDLAKAERDTSINTRLNLTIALSYGARAEIAAAARAAAAAVCAGRLDAGDLGEETFERFLATAGMPDPDLIIRTSGEQRLSNFLLWQAAYAELVFLDVLWPDFDQPHFEAALAEFARRDRRFGTSRG